MENSLWHCQELQCRYILKKPNYLKGSVKVKRHTKNITAQQLISRKRERERKIIVILCWRIFVSLVDWFLRIVFDHESILREWICKSRLCSFVAVAEAGNCLFHDVKINCKLSGSLVCRSRSKAGKLRHVKNDWKRPLLNVLECNFRFSI